MLVEKERMFISLLPSLKIKRLYFIIESQIDGNTYHERFSLVDGAGFNIGDKIPTIRKKRKWQLLK